MPSDSKSATVPGKSTGSRLIRNSVASVASKASVFLCRVATVPLLVWFLGAEQYGQWLLISAVPSLLSLTSFSLGTVASNAITLEVARGDLQAARQTFSTTLFTLGAVALICVTAVAGIAFVVASDGVGSHWLPHDSPSVLLTAGVLAVAVLVSFFSEPFAARLRAAGRADLWIGLNALPPWVELICCGAALLINTSYLSLATGLLASRILSVILSWWVSRCVGSGVHFAWASVEPARIFPLLKKGLAYQALPLGNALSNQAILMVVGAVLGPLAVAVFGTARTMARLGTQGMELINHAVWPELTLLLGEGEYRRAAIVHRAAATFTLLAGSITALGACMAGPWLFRLWTVGELSATHLLMAILGIGIVLQSLWHASLIVQLSVNDHEGVAIRYVLAAILAVALCYPLSRAFGIYGAAASSMVIDLILMPYCLLKAVAITRDTVPEFIGGLLPAARQGFEAVKRRVGASGCGQFPGR